MKKPHSVIFYTAETDVDGYTEVFENRVVIDGMPPHKSLKYAGFPDISKAKAYLCNQISQGNIPKGEVKF